MEILDVLSDICDNLINQIDFLIELEEEYNRLKKLFNDVKKLIKDIDNEITKHTTSNQSIHSTSIYGSILAFGSLDKKLINKFANNENICDCFLSVLEYFFNFTFEIPESKKFNFFTYESNPDLINKVSFNYTYGEFLNNESPSSEITNIKLKKLFQANVSTDTKFADKPLILTSDYFKALEEGFKNDLPKLKTSPVFLDVYYSRDDIKNYIQNSDISAGKVSYSNITNNNLYKVFISFMDKHENNIEKLRYLFTIEKYEDDFNEDLPYGLDEKVNPVNNLFYVDMDITPSVVSASEYFKHYLFARKYKDELQKSSNKIFNSINDTLINDEKNFYEAKQKAENLLNALNINLGSTKTLDNIDQLRLNNYYIYCKNVYDQFFSTYHSIDLINDPSDSYISPFYNHDYEGELDNTIIPYTIDAIIDEYINKRKALIKDNYSDFIKYFVYQENIKKLEQFITSFRFEFTMWVWVKPYLPCQCTFICGIIQSIINYILSLLTSFIDRTVALITDWFWKTSMGKFIKFLIIKLRCVDMILKFKDDLDKLDILSDSLIQGLKNNIALYKDDPSCILLNQDKTQIIPDESDEKTNTFIKNLMNNLPVLDDKFKEAVNGTYLKTPKTNKDKSIDEDNNDNDVSKITAPKLDVKGSLASTLQINIDPTSSSENRPILEVFGTVNSKQEIIYPNHNFKLLEFNCSCETDCVSCNDPLTKEETQTILSRI
jgi:hypothetical protein